MQEGGRNSGEGICRAFDPLHEERDGDRGCRAPRHCDSREDGEDRLRDRCLFGASEHSGVRALVGANPFFGDTTLPETTDQVSLAANPAIFFSILPANLFRLRA
jgi:hypothetical protein